MVGRSSVRYTFFRDTHRLYSTGNRGGGSAMEPTWHCHGTATMALPPWHCRRGFAAGHDAAMAHAMADTMHGEAMVWATRHVPLHPHDGTPRQAVVLYVLLLYFLFSIPSIYSSISIFALLFQSPTSSSLPFVTQIHGTPNLSRPPSPHYGGTCLRFYRGKS